MASIPKDATPAGLLKVKSAIKVAKSHLLLSYPAHPGKALLVGLLHCIQFLQNYQNDQRIGRVANFLIFVGILATLGVVVTFRAERLGGSMLKQEEYKADKKGDTCCVTAAFLMLRHEL